MLYQDFGMRSSSSTKRTVSVIGTTSLTNLASVRAPMKLGAYAAGGGLTRIANCYIHIAYCDMRLGEKLRYLRLVEGTLRGLEREMTQQEVVRAIKAETRRPISQAYLSQIENGVRPHLTNATRMLLARFFKVHPGYLVDDPEGYQTGLASDVRTIEDQLDLWLIEGAERFRLDGELRQSLLAAAMHEDSRRC